MNTAVYDYLINLGELTELNFDRTFDEFVSLVQNVMEKHAPLKRLSRKQQKLKSKPWIDYKRDIRNDLSKKQDA